MDVRETFIEYFEKKGHMVLASSGLIPHNDRSVLLTTAGMQQFKPYFLGIKNPPSKRITTVQKCFRTSDIDSVGYTDKHLTFFEMLGNFSFGDYFKKEAINYSLDFLLNELKIPADRLKVAVFKGNKDIPADLESVKYWKESGITGDKIYRFGKDDNFWGPAGDTGPCGPCSEIYYDFGEEYGCGKKTCSPKCDCNRFLEIWNLVFTQYNYDGKNYKELPQKNIDTGMGLERIMAVLEGVPSVFKTSLFVEIIRKIEELSDKNSRVNKPEFDRSLRIIADHIRAIYFLISDGVVPSNEKRGYILRRIIRRCIRFGRLIGINDYFLNDIGEVVINKYSKWYPELLEKKNFSFKMVSDEEKRFTRTLKEGNKVLIQKVKEIKKAKGKYINPGDAFRLYDTYGFPVELTGEILSENKIKIDLNKFNRYLKEHTKKSKSKGSSGVKLNKDIELYGPLSKEMKVEFLGYNRSNLSTVIEKIIKTDGDGNKKFASQLIEAEEGEIILRETPFYGEMGGQVGDRGSIRKDNNIFKVTGCFIPVEGIYTHKGSIKKGKLKVGDGIIAEVDSKFKKNVSRNHTATHILHWALKSIYGNEVKQAGSFVGEDRFRFDYSIYNAPSESDIKKIEAMVNEKIQKDEPVRCYETTREYAGEIGAIALFDEKYGRFVRVVEINNYSRELCGGIHVGRTGEIGLFKIISDSGTGANLRRIEALTGIHAYRYLEKKDEILNKISAGLEVKDSRIPEAIEKLKDNIKKRENELLLLKMKVAKREIIKKSGFKPSDTGLKIIDYDFSDSDLLYDMEISGIGKVGDWIIDYFKGLNTFLIFGSRVDNKSVLILNSTADLSARGVDCGKIAGEIGKQLEGGGGGKPKYAQMGFSDRNTGKAIKLVRDRVLGILKDK